MSDVIIEFFFATHRLDCGDALTDDILRYSAIEFGTIVHGKWRCFGWIGETTPHTHSMLLGAVWFVYAATWWWNSCSSTYSTTWKRRLPKSGGSNTNACQRYPCTVEFVTQDFYHHVFRTSLVQSSLVTHTHTHLIPQPHQTFAFENHAKLNEMDEFYSEINIVIFMQFQILSSRLRRFEFKVWYEDAFADAKSIICLGKNETMASTWICASNRLYSLLSVKISIITYSLQ